MSAGTKVVHALVNSPLPLLIQKLGLSIATAQAALDENSIEIAKKMAATKVQFGDKEYNLINLGFVPSFYAFTDAVIEAKVEFMVAESEDFAINASVGVDVGIVAVNVGVSYARKYEMSAQGSSSISTRLVSLPPPERLSQILTELAEAVPITNSNNNTTT